MKNVLPDHVQEWVLHAVNSQGKIVAIQQLLGGMSSVMHKISIQSGEVLKDVVIRQVDNEEWLEEEPDLALHEAKSLEWAIDVDVPTPNLIAYDQSGAICGVPTVLMTKLEGVVELQPKNMEEWVDGLANALAKVHQLNADHFPYTYFTYQNLSTLEVPSWSSYKEQWRQVIDIVKGPRPKTRECFIHRDYHAANVLWTGNKVSGIVDWVNACKGPAGIDVGHCRVDMAQLHGVENSDAFLTAYQKHAGELFLYDPYWDLIALIDILFGPPEVYPGWPALGVKGLTNEIIAHRLDEYMLSLLKRI